MTGGIPKHERNLELVYRIDNAKANGELLQDIYKEFGITKQRGRQIYVNVKSSNLETIDKRLVYKPSHFYIELTDSQQKAIMLKVKSRLEFLGRYSNNDLRGSIQEARYTNQDSSKAEAIF